MAERTVEDRLREEYFALLPDVRRVAEELETKVRHCLLPISSRLDRYERLVITSRIKECESALDALRRRQEFATFDRDRPERYTLHSLKDLAGIRVSVFPGAAGMKPTRNCTSNSPLGSRIQFWTRTASCWPSNTTVTARQVTRFGASSRSCRC